MPQKGVLDARIRPHAWHLLLQDVRRLIPGAQAVSLWCRSGQSRALRFQTAWGFRHPDVFMDINLDASSPWGLALDTEQPRVLDRGQWQIFLLSQPQWADLYEQAQGTQTQLPQRTLILPWPQAASVFSFDAWDTAIDLAPPPPDAWQALLKQYRFLGHVLAGWSAFARAIAGALDAFPRLLTTAPEEFFGTALDILRTILPYDRAVAWMRQENALVLRAVRGLEDGPISIPTHLDLQGHPLIQALQTTRRPLWMPTGRLLPQMYPQDSPSHSCLSLPVFDETTGRLLGILMVERDVPYGFLGNEMHMGMRFVHSLADFLSYNQAFQEARQTHATLQQRTHYLEALYHLSESLTQTLDPNALWRMASQHIHEVLQAQQTQSWAYQEDDGQFHLVSQLPTFSNQVRALSFAQVEPLLATLKQGQVLYIANPSQDERLKALIPPDDGSPAHLLLLPVGQEERFHGFLWVVREMAFQPEEQHLAQTMARQLATALHNAQLYQISQSLTQDLEQRVRERTRALEQERRRAQLLAQAFAELAGSLDLDQILNRTLETLVDGLPVDQALVMTTRADQEHLFWQAGRGHKRPIYGGQTTSISREDTVARVLLQDRVPLVIPDTSHHPEPLDAWWTLLERQYGSLIAVPLLIGAESLGGLVLLRENPGSWDIDDVEMLQTIGMQMATAIQNAELFEIIQEQAENLGALFRQQQIEAQRAKAILDSVADGIVVTDAHGTITLLNPSAERLLNIRAQQVLGRPLDHFLGIFGPAAAQWMDAVQLWYQDPTAYQNEVAETQVETESGRVLSVRLAPVFLKREFLGTVSVIRDITHHIEVDRMKSAFVANVSHELRTPLTAIKGYVEVLLAGMTGDLTDRQKHFLTIIRNHADRLVNLVNDLLDLSRLESGRIRIQPEKVELEPLLREVVRDFRRRIQKEKRQLELRREVEEALPAVYADAKRTEQILANLLENAIRYTPDGGTITVMARRYDENFVVIAVQDTGIGIAPEDQDKVFERFYRGHHPLVLASPGTGLGLPIVRQLVEMQGGRIWLESEGIPGKGTTFYFTLPIYTGQEPFPEGRT